MSTLDSLGKSIGEVIDERMSSPLISSFTIAWGIINYKFFVILFSDTPVKQTFLMIHEMFPDAWDLALRGFIYPLLAALFYLFVLPKPSQFVYEHWRKLQKWKNDTNYKYDSEAYETLAKSRAQRERINELVSELKNLNAENEQMRLDAKEQHREIIELKARTVGEEVDALKEVLHNVTQEREEFRKELDERGEELRRTREIFLREKTELLQKNEAHLAEKAKIQQHLSISQSELASLRKQFSDSEVQRQAIQQKLDAAEDEHLNALAEVERVLAESSRNRALDDKTLSPGEKLVSRLMAEDLVKSPFDVDQLSILKVVGENRGASAEGLYKISPLSDVHIDYCLVELTNQGFVGVNHGGDYEDASYYLTQEGRRVYVRAAQLQKTAEIAR